MQNHEKIALPRISRDIDEIRALLFGYIEQVQDVLVANAFLPFRLNLNKGIFRGLIEIFAWGLWQIYTLLAVLLAQAAPYHSTGKWLDLHADGVNLKRRTPTKAKGFVLLIRDVNSQGNVIIPAMRIFRTLPDGKGEIFRYTNLASAVLLAGQDFVDIAVESETYGASANAGAGQICEIVNPIVGISSITNRADWLIEEGANEESDEQLAHRYSLAWASNNGCTKYAYESWALSVPGVTSVSILDKHPRGQGTVDIVVRGADVLPTESLLEKVREAIAPNTPINDDWLVKSPIPVSVTISGTVECIHVDPATLLLIAENRLRALFAEKSVIEGVYALKIGQDVPLDLLTYTVLSVPSVKSVTWDMPLEDVIVSASSVARLESLTLSFCEAKEI